MSSSNVIANLTSGNNTAASSGLRKIGIPVMNNSGPSMGVNNSSGAVNPYALSPVAIAPVAGVPSITPTPSPLTGQTPQQNQELNKQLVDTFGKGEGNLLNTEIGNIGSGDSSYLQAYENSMAQPEAEQSATLNTTLANEGVSGNSSTAAIANADFNSGVVATEGLQEQQLQMNDEQNLLGLTQGLEGQSAKEVSSGGFFNDLGDVLNAGAGLAGSFFGLGGVAGFLNGLGGSSSSNPITGITPFASGSELVNPTDSSLTDLL